MTQSCLSNSATADAVLSLAIATGFSYWIGAQTTREDLEI